MFKARSSLFAGLFLLVSFLGVKEIQAQGQRLTREPFVTTSQNSQTMNLLEGHQSLGLVAVGGGDIEIVDNSALVAEKPVSENFAEFGLNNSGQISIYIVREGDTLSDIARMFGVSVNTIAWANDIKGGRISIGRELVILPISGVKHLVTKGDTLETIAKKYKADLADLLAYNGLSTDSKLAIGDVVIVPDGEISTVSSSSSGSSSISAPTGYYGRPIAGGRKTQGLHGHNGIDFGAPIGTPVLSSAEGTVIVARSSGWNGGYGLYVVISHGNGTQTLYSHLSQVNVTSGTRVVKGETIGKVGSTGRSTGPHLHFEVRGARNPF